MHPQGHMKYVAIMFQKSKGPWTWLGVHVHAQQQPASVLWAGKPKTSAANFQSCLTSTRAARTNGLAVFRQLSDFRQAVPSCRHVGHTPVARIVSDHFTTANTSSQVSEHTLLWAKASNGILKFLNSFEPGSEMEITSMDSPLSHWVGAPSPQIPMPNSLHPACASQCTKCSFVKGSINSWLRILSMDPYFSNTATISWISCIGTSSLTIFCNFGDQVLTLAM